MERFEAEGHWRGFLEDRARRGLCGVKRIVADGHASLKAARSAVFPGSAARFTGSRTRKPLSPASISGNRWRKDAPKRAEWAAENLADGFAVFGFPPSHRVRLRTTHGLERINRELKRRTRVTSIFPNLLSCLRLVSALLAECDEEGMTRKIYLTLKA